MSVTFDIRGMKWPADAEGFEWPPAEMFVNLSNANAGAFFAWLGVDGGEYLCGEMRARELAVVVRRRLAQPAAHAADVGVAATVQGRVIECGRAPGRLVQAAGQLLALAEYAGDLGVVVWS